METILVLVFILGYLGIALEHSLKIDKLIPALAMMAILWALIAFGIGDFTTWFDSAKCIHLWRAFHHFQVKRKCT